MPPPGKDPETAQTLRHERKQGGAPTGLAAEIDRQKKLIFEMFQRGDPRPAIKKERDRLRQLQRMDATGASADASAGTALQGILEEISTGRTTRHAAKKGTDRRGKGTGKHGKGTGKQHKSTAITKADTTQLDAAIRQERRLIAAMFERGEDKGAGREKLKQHRDKLRMLERQRDRIGASVVEADEQVVERLNRREPSRLLQLLAVGTPFFLLAVLIQRVTFRPFGFASPWWAMLLLTAVPYAILVVAWRRLQHFRVLGVIFPLIMIVVNTCFYTLGLFTEPDWAMALGFISWVLIGMTVAFVDPD